MAARSSDYVLDELLCFLSNPLFQVPVLSFMESNCLIFDASTEDSQEYRQVHEQYRKLVDALLEAFRADTGLTHDQIIKAMKDLNAKPELRKIFQELFEQVLAMDEFPIFLHLMINKNLELQKQALMLITMMHGGLPSSLQEGGGDSQDAAPPASQQDEDEVLKAVLEQSKKEYEAQMRQSKKEDEDYKAVIIISQVETMRLDEEAKKENERLSQAMQSSLQAGDGLSQTKPGGLASLPALPRLADEKPSAPSAGKTSSVPAPATYQNKPKPAQPTPAVPLTSPTPKPAPLVAKHDLGVTQAGDRGRTSKDAAADWLSAAQQEVKSSDAHSQAVYAAAASMAGMSEEDYKKRVAFLKQQRDKLMEMKRREREKQLLSAASSQPNRPSSARAARAALQKPEKQDEPSSGLSAEEEKKLAMRRAIASRIKSEVMDMNQ